MSIERQTSSSSLDDSSLELSASAFATSAILALVAFGASDLAAAAGVDLAAVAAGASSDSSSEDDSSLDSAALPFATTAGF